MTSGSPIADAPSLAQLPWLPYIDDEGQLPPDLVGKIGVYAIFDQERSLQFVGYSRDIAMSLKQHLVRQPHHCYWLKLQTIDRPSRAALDDMSQAWIAENGSVPPGNEAGAIALWTQDIDVRPYMTEADHAAYAASEDRDKAKTLKAIARRVEATILDTLKARGVAIPLRFDPKLKDDGYLGLKSV